jgi:hypothetical protein
MSTSTTNLVGGLAAIDLASHNQTAGRASAASQPKQVIVQHIDQAASQLTAPLAPNPSPANPPSQDDNRVTLVATPKTMSWTAIIFLMTIGILGMVGVLVYSLVKPGRSVSTD